MVTVATYNLENLFSRPKAFNTGSWAEGEKVLAAYRKFNTLIATDTYSDADKVRMRELLVELGVYYRNTREAIRRQLNQNPALGGRPTDWDTYLEMTSSVHQASDHAAVVITLDL